MDLIYCAWLTILMHAQEFKASDRQWLLRVSPPGSKILWFGSPRDTGTGSIDRLVKTIKSGRITRSEWIFKLQPVLACICVSGWWI